MTVLTRLLCAMLLTGYLAGPAQAGDALLVTGAWIREAPPVAKVHAAYLTLENPGTIPVRVDSVTSPDFGSIEIHRSWIEDGVARMQAITHLEVPPGGRLALEPGDHHLMLFKAQRPLQAGDTVTLLLHLAGDNSCIRVSAPVRRATDTGHHHH